MQKNVGGADRVARLVIGSVLLVVGVAGYAGLVGLAVGPVPQALASLLVVLVGAILLVTGITRWCPLNRLFGIDTYRDADETEESGPARRSG